jgi:hypothetical protein
MPTNSAEQNTGNVSIIGISKTGILGEGSNLLVDVTEVGLDQLLKEGVFREIPLLGSAVGVVKIYIHAKDWLLQRNLSRFRYHLQNIPEDKKQRFMNRLREDNTFRQRVGENLLLLLNRVNDIRKPELMANVFKAFVEGIIDDVTYQKLSTAVDRIRVHDLPGLTEFYCEEEPATLEDDVLQDLVICGLASIVSEVGLAFGSSKKPIKNVTKNSLGKLFIEIALGKAPNPAST